MLFSALEVIKHGRDGGWGEVLIEIVIDLNHGGVDASTQTLDLHEMKKSVVRVATHLYTELCLDRIENLVAATEHARRRGADLHVKSADPLAVKHCVKGSDLVNANWRHLEDARDLVHRRERKPSAGLPLSKVEQWDYGRRRVIRWTFRPAASVRGAAGRRADGAARGAEAEARDAARRAARSIVADRATGTTDRADAEAGQGRHAAGSRSENNVLDARHAVLPALLCGQAGCVGAQSITLNVVIAEC
jgi:hypothetical protein